MPDNDSVKVNSSEFKPNWIAFIAITVFILALISLVGFLYLNPKKSVEKASNTQSETKVVREGQIRITSDGFEPSVLKVSPGTKVTWVNQDETKHRVTSDPHPLHTSLKELDSGEMDKGVTYSFTFKEKGSFTYHDEFSPLDFVGEVVVE